MVRVAGPFAGAVIWVAAAALGSALLHEAALYTQAPALLATLHLALALALLVVLDRVAVFPLQLSRPTWQALYSSHPGALAQGLRVVLLARVLGRTSLATGVAATAVGRVAGPALAAAAVGAEAAPLATAAVAVASGGLLMSLLGSGAGLSVGTAVEAGLLVASTAAHTAWHKIRLGGAGALERGSLPEWAQAYLRPVLAGQGDVSPFNAVLYENAAPLPVLAVASAALGELRSGAHVGTATAAIVSAVAFAASSARRGGGGVAVIEEDQQSWKLYKQASPCCVHIPPAVLSSSTWRPRDPPWHPSSPTSRWPSTWRPWCPWASTPSPSPCRTAPPRPS